MKVDLRDPGTRPVGRLVSGWLLCLGGACASVSDAPGAPTARGSGAHEQGVLPAGTRTPEARLDGDVAAATDSRGEGVESSPLRGWISARYRARFGGSEDDHDLWTTVSADFGDARSDSLTGSFLGRLTTRLADDGALFAGLEDTYDGALNGKVYHAYVDVHSVEALETLRLGRQRLWDTPELVVFDGALIETSQDWPEGIGGADFGLYGGVPAHFYESSPAGDSVLGAFAEGRPWSGGRLRLDWMHLEDESRLGEAQNDLWGLAVWHFSEGGALLEGEYTRLEGEDRDLRLAAGWEDPDTDLSLRLSYYQLLETQRNYALEADPFFAALRDYEPHHQVGLLASKSVARNLHLQLGVDVRRLDDSDDEGDFNHEFEHYFLTATIPEAFGPKLAASLTADSWEDDQQDVQTWGVDLTRELSDEVEGSLGSYYSLYKYDLFFDTERDDVRTYYGRVQYQRTKELSFDLRFDYEDDDYEDYQTLRLGARWLF